MVLKISTIVFLFGTFIFLNEGPLFDQYKSKIDKEIHKLFDENLELELLDSSLKNVEAYAIKSKEQQAGFLFIMEVKACSLNGCTSQKSVSKNVGSEYFDIAVITDSETKILSLKVLDYFSDYGYEISSKRYLKQYNNKFLCDFNLDNPQVDGISGATISYVALTNGLETLCEIVKPNYQTDSD